MGYLDNFIWQPLIENPRFLWGYRRIITSERWLKKKSEKEKEKEKNKEMREKLWDEEYIKWRRRQYYEKKKEWRAQQYQEKKALAQKEIMETYHTLYDNVQPLPPYNQKEIDYINSLRKDYTSKAGKWVFFRWASRLCSVKFSTVLPWTEPIRICENIQMNRPLITWLRKQQAVANALRPHLSEFSLDDIVFVKKQTITWHPNYFPKWRLSEVIKENNLPTNVACEIASAMLRWVYIDSLYYLWHHSYLLWDMIGTGNWQRFLPLPNCSLNYLTCDSSDEVHKKTIAWLNREKANPPLYILRDCYLLQLPASKFKNEEWEEDSNKQFYYYIAPFNWLKEK